MFTNSSKKRTQGAADLALSKMSLTLASLSPNHMVSSSGPLTEMKLAWHSLAMALARSVLPNTEKRLLDLSVGDCGIKTLQQ